MPVCTASALEFLRASWSSLLPSREFPFGVVGFDDLLSASNLPRLVRVFHELIQSFLRRRRSDTLDLAEEVVERNPAMALQTSLISLEDALEVELGFVQVNRLKEGKREEILNLCQTVSRDRSNVGTQVGSMNEHS
jgi:hypothetical protein